jgi:hypothetical protein
MNKKFISPLPVGGLPITNEDFLMIQNEAHESISALAKGIGNAFVVNGCVSSVSGSTLTITSGVVYIDNQFMIFDGYTGSYPVYIKAGSATKETRVFKDGFVKEATVTTKAAVVTAAPSTGGYITCNPHTYRMHQVITAEVRVDINNNSTNITNLTNNKADKTTTDTLRTDLEAEKTQRSNDVIALDGRLDTAETNITNLSNNKADKTTTTDLQNNKADKTQLGGINMKVVDIGDWNMDVDMTITKTLPVSVSVVRALSITIRNDGGTGYYTMPLFAPNDLWVTMNPSNNTFQLNRRDAGTFDSTEFDATAYNRGWITIWHV